MHERSPVAGKVGVWPPDKVAEEAALTKAIKLFVLSAEYHATNLNVPTSTPRPELGQQKARTHPYKGLVVLNLEGGADTFNMLVPHSGCSRAVDPTNKTRQAHDLYSEYAAIRSDPTPPLMLSLRTRRTFVFVFVHRRRCTCPADVGWWVGVGDVLVPSLTHQRWPGVHGCRATHCRAASTNLNAVY